MKETVFDRKMAFDHVNNFLSEQYETVNTFKSHVRDLLNSVALIITASGLLLGNMAKEISLSPIFIVVAFVLFGLIGWIYGFIIKPVKLDMPIKSTKTNIKKLFFNKSEVEIYDNLIGNSPYAINKNRKIIEIIGKWSNFSSYLFLGIIVTLTIALLISFF